MTNFVKVKVYDVKNHWFNSLDFSSELDLKKGDHVVIPGHKTMNLMEYGTVTSRINKDEEAKNNAKKHKPIKELYAGELNMPTKEEAYQLREPIRKAEAALGKKYGLKDGETSAEYEKELAKLRGNTNSRDNKGFFKKIISFIRN